MNDYVVRVMTTNQEIRALAVNSTEVVEKARDRHQTTPVATAALGRALSGTLLLGAMLKSGDQVGLKIVGEGPLGKIVTEANKQGQVRGYVGNPKLGIKSNQAGKLDVAWAIGNGQLQVKKWDQYQGASEGSVPLVSGEIGEDLTYYFTQSEQTPSSVGLGVLVDTDLSVKAAGGFIIQLMPEASEETINQLEVNLAEIDSVSRLIAEGSTPEELLEEVLAGFEFKVLAEQDVEFNCRCSREQITEVMASLGQEEIEATLEQEGQLEIECHFCGQKYQFDEPEAKEILNN